MKNDQSCDALGSEEYIKVVPDLDFDQISSDEEEITEQRIAGINYICSGSIWGKLRC